MIKNKKEFYDRHAYSYLTLRQAVGWIGFSLPFALVLPLVFFSPTHSIEPSISHYYHTDMRSVFVGVLCAVALFMFFYTGYDQWDNRLGHLAGVFALGIAWFPTTKCGEIDTAGIIHFVCGAGFFVITCIMCYSRFTKTKEGKDEEGKPLKPTEEKQKRNKRETKSIVCVA